MSICQMVRTGTSSRQDAPHDLGQRTVRVAHLEPRLARQACVHQGVVPRATIQLGQDDAGHNDFPPKARRRLESGTNLHRPAPLLLGQGNQSFRVKDDATAHVRRPTYFSTRESSTGPYFASNSASNSVRSRLRRRRSSSTRTAMLTWAESPSSS